MSSNASQRDPRQGFARTRSEVAYRKHPAETVSLNTMSRHPELPISSSVTVETKPGVGTRVAARAPPVLPPVKQRRFSGSATYF